MRPSRRSRVPVILAVLLSLTALDLLAVWAFYRHVESATPRNDPGPFDAGVVFFADERKIGPMTMRNLGVALELHQKKAFPIIVAIGGSRPASGFFGSESMRDWLIDRGVPAEAIRTERESFGADSGWAAMSKQLRQLDARRVTLITDPMHQLRLQQRFRLLPEIDFTVNTYLYKDAVPAFSFVEKIYRAHYEITAILADKLIPSSFYHSILRHMRT